MFSRPAPELRLTAAASRDKGRERICTLSQIKHGGTAKYALRPCKKGAKRFLACVSKRESCKFEWIFRQRKYGSPRFSGAKSRLSDAVVAKKPPTLQLKEF